MAKTFYDFGARSPWNRLLPKLILMTRPGTD